VSLCSALQSAAGVREVKRRWLLRTVVVRVALEDAEVATDAATEATAGKHADDRFFNHELGLRGHDGLVGTDAG
jgi:hypothetical protein